MNLSSRKKKPLVALCSLSAASMAWWLWAPAARADAADHTAHIPLTPNAHCGGRGHSC